MNRRDLLRQVVVTAGAFGLGALPFGCKRAETSSEPLRLGLSDWPGHAPFYGAKKLGLFDPTPVELKGFGSNFDRNRAFAQGRLEALAAPLFDALKIIDGGTDLRIVLLFDYSSGGDGIVARNGISSVADLKGKRVSVELGAITHFVLLAALKSAGLKETDVTIVNLSVPEGAEAFTQGKVDAATLWDPHLSRLALLEGARKIFTSKEIPGQVIDVLMVQRAVATSRAADVANLVRGWQRSLLLWKKNPTEHETLMASQMPGRTQAGLHGDFSGLELLDLEANDKLFGATGGGPSAANAFETTVAFMQQAKLLERPPLSASTVLDRSFVDRARVD